MTSRFIIKINENYKKKNTYLPLQRLEEPKSYWELPLTVESHGFKKPNLIWGQSINVELGQ